MADETLVEELEDGDSDEDGDEDSDEDEDADSDVTEAVNKSVCILKFYAKSSWRYILDRARLLSHCDATIEGFPNQLGMLTSCAEEYLNKAIIQYEECGLTIDQSYLKQYGYEMKILVCASCHWRSVTKFPLSFVQLYNDLGIFGSFTKKAACIALTQTYDFTPPTKYSHTKVKVYVRKIYDFLQEQMKYLHHKMEKVCVCVHVTIVTDRSYSRASG